MILDWITDWFVTVWELIGLAFLSAGADPINFDQWEASGGSRKRNERPSAPASLGRRNLQHHFA